MTRTDLIENLNTLCRHLREQDLGVAANVCERAAEQVQTDATELERLRANQREPADMDPVTFALQEKVRQE